MVVEATGTAASGKVQEVSRKQEAPARNESSAANSGDAVKLEINDERVAAAKQQASERTEAQPEKASQNTEERAAAASIQQA